MKPQEEYDASYKVVVCGESGVGKSNIVRRFVEDKFSTETKSTVGLEFLSKTIEQNGRRVKIQVWDLGGDPKLQHRNLVSAFFRGANGILVVFDITNRSSFDGLDYWIQEVQEQAGDDVPIIIVGNKGDLNDRRVVSAKEASDYAAFHGASYMECSAATGQGVTLVFEQLAQDISTGKTSTSQAARPAAVELQSASAYQRRRVSLSKIDDVFGDLENMFNGLGHYLFKYTCVETVESWTVQQKALLFLPRLIVQVLMYILFFTLLVLILLPSFFWLLLLRTRTVEIESTDFGIRQDALSQESAAAKSMRVVTLIFRSAPMTFLLGCWPMIIILTIIPTYATESNPSHTSSVVLWAIGTHLVLILILQMLGTIRNSKSLDMKEQAKLIQYQDNPFRWKNLGNWIAIITLTVDFVQICMWPLQRLQPDQDGASNKAWNTFGTSAEDDHSSGSSAIDFVVQDLIPALFLRLSDHMYQVTFFIAIGCVVLLLLIFTYQFMQDVLAFEYHKNFSTGTDPNNFFFHSFVGAMVYGHGILKDVSPKVTGLVSWLSDAMFMTVCSQLLSMLSCSYSSDFSDFNTGALLANPNVQCWTGDHKHKAVLSLISFSYYVPLCVMVAPMFMSCDPEKKDVRFMETYMMTLTLAKCALLVFSTFFSQSNLMMVIASMLVSLALLICTFFWSMTKPRLTKPCSQPFANILKCTTYSSAIWVSIVALTFYAAGNNGYMNSQGQWIAIAVGIALNVAAGVAWFLLSWMPTRKETKYHALPEEEVELTDNTYHS